MELLCMHNRSLLNYKILAPARGISAYELEKSNIGNERFCNDTAVTIMNGYALCKRHYNEHVARLDACSYANQKEEKELDEIKMKKMMKWKWWKVWA